MKKSKSIIRICRRTGIAKTICNLIVKGNLSNDNRREKKKKDTACHMDEMKDNVITIIALTKNAKTKGLLHQLLPPSRAQYLRLKF